MWFLQSRKIQVAVATLVAAVVGELGFNLDTNLILAIVTTGIGLILGIAHEDSGAKSASTTVVVDPAKLAASVMPGPTVNTPKTFV